MSNRIKLGELLVRAGVLDEANLRAALAEQQRWGGRIGRILVELGFVTEDLLTRALSKQLGIPRATFEAVTVPAAILDRIDPAHAEAHGYCPEAFDPERRVLTVGMLEPEDVQVVDELRFATGVRIQPAIAGERPIKDAIARWLRRSRPVAEALSIEQDVPDLGPAPDPRLAAALAASGPAMLESVPGQAPRRGPPAGPPLAAAGEVEELVRRIEAAQRQQQKAIRVMLELLIEKGVFSRDEYLALVHRR
jgi:hypothetical protein